jgi:hypothetical protein
MMVVMTSWAPLCALRKPEMKPQNAPPARPAISATSRFTTIGSGSEKPATAAQMQPITAWPWPPMLNRPPRNASATDRPVKTSGAAYVSVSEIGVNAACQEPLPFSHAVTAAGSNTAPRNRSAYAELTTAQLALMASLGRAVT